MAGHTLVDLAYELNNDFSAQNLSNYFEMMELIPENQECRIEQFEKFIFLQGNQEESYTAREREFIKQIDQIYVMPFGKYRIKSGNMPCYVIAVDLSSFNDIFYAVFFMKVVIKAVVGFVVFAIKLYDGTYIGIKLFDRVEWNNCTLSKCDDISTVVDEGLWAIDDTDFLELYNSLVELIKPVSQRFIDYDYEIIHRQGIQTSYIEMLHEVEKLYGESIIEELERYQNSFEEEKDTDYVEYLGECIENLQYIRTSRVNTLEMLFEADELEKMADKAEKEWNRDLEVSASEDENEGYNIIGEMNNDPEAIIKRLKILKGL